MLRTMTARVGTAAMLASLVVVSAPTSSEAARDFKPWGKASSKNHVLKRGCHDYTYRYKINAPTDQWSAEIFFVAPNGIGLAAATLDTNADKDKGKRKLTVCRHSAQYGRYTIKMKITYSEGRTIREGFVKPTKFRFTRPR